MKNEKAPYGPPTLQRQQLLKDVLETPFVTTHGPSTSPSPTP